ncbi:glucose dehydrogenase [FAD, quinone]-like [Hermetia illucens]|nr:glucose dehydrogenase [FAD, quinone]-like [Hermetia illucens]
MKDETCIWNKGKLLGGSHSINAMLYLRGNPRDYQDWVNEGNPAWSWNDIQYYFQKTEKFKGNQSGVHGTYGPMNVETYRGPKLDEFMFMKAAKELGYNAVEDFSAGPYLGFGRVYGTLKNGRRMTTAKAFLTQKRPNLHIIKHAVARKIKFTRKLKAETVSFVYKGRYQMEVKARKEIILCAGSIETPKLLMLSGLGPRIHLKALGLPVIKNLPVGNNLQDHVRVDLFFKLKIKQTLGMDSEFLDSVYSQWVYRNGPFGKPGLDITGFINTDGVGLYPDIQLILSRIDNITAFQPNWKPYILQSFENQIHPPDTIFFISVILVRPRSRGLVRLQSLDYRHNPFILPNYFQDADDMRRLVRGIHKVLEFPNTPILNDFDAEFLRPNLPTCDEHEYQSTRYWKCYSRYMTNTVWHPCGTAKMGPRNSKSAVVDSELRVHGVKGLRIIDASVMPNLVSSNINAAVIMIGEKGADLVKTDKTI